MHLLTYAYEINTHQEVESKLTQSKAHKPQLLNLCAATTEACAP